MWFESVEAVAFGDRSGETLELAPGMTIVLGPNEAGKSTWLDALYAGLCGRRRARGQRPREERAFEDRRRPWGDERWEVGLVLSLEDGRRIELRHDLVGLVDCRAVDLALGRDVSDEILNEGTPDGARWLGLDRRSFLATACVRQAELLAVCDDPSLLREHLQRAAASAAGDETAAAALERIEAYAREHVGVDRAGARRPLRLAREAVDDAERRLAAARKTHAEHQALAARAEEATRRSREAASHLQGLRAAVLAREAIAGRERLERARSLAKRFAEGRPTPPAEEDALAREVAAALAAWKGRRAPRALEGPSADALKEELAKLPPVPEGDCTPAPEVADAAEALRDARRRLQLHASGRPHEETLALPRAPGKAALAAAGLVLLGVLAATGLGFETLGLSLAAAGGAAFLWVALRALAARAAASEQARRLAADWEEQCAVLEAGRARRERALAEALGRRGVAVCDPLDDALDAYERACRDRARQARDAERRPELANRLSAREAAERATAELARAWSEAEEALRRCATRCGLKGVGDAELAEGLGAWQRRRSERLERYQRALEEYAELEQLLGGRTLEATECEVIGLEERAAAQRRATGAVAARVRSAEDLPGLLARGESEARRAADEAQRLCGQVQAHATALDGVPEAEEALAAAREELERVRGLERTLDLAREHLARAQDRVHRDIAPVLADTLRRGLPRVTASRYADVTVDPATLDVRVRAPGGHWRRAVNLSHGTAEQVHLLLRIALAQHLTQPGERCPLLLDDVTVQSDAQRTRAVLELLHEVSREHQVILFSQEAGVEAWAAAHLKSERDHLVRLPVRSPARPVASR